MVTRVCVQKGTGEQEYKNTLHSSVKDLRSSTCEIRISLCVCVCVCMCAVGCSVSSPLQWSCQEQVRVTTMTVPTVHSVLSRTRILCVSVSMVMKECNVRSWSASTSSIENRSCRSPLTSLQNRPIYHYRYITYCIYRSFC